MFYQTTETPKASACDHDTTPITNLLDDNEPKQKIIKFLLYVPTFISFCSHALVPSIVSTFIIIASHVIVQSTIGGLDSGLSTQVLWKPADVHTNGRVRKVLLQNVSITLLSTVSCHVVFPNPAVKLTSTIVVSKETTFICISYRYLTSKVFNYLRSLALLAFLPGLVSGLFCRISTPVIISCLVTEPMSHRNFILSDIPTLLRSNS